MKSLFSIVFLFSLVAAARPEVSVPSEVEISQRALMRLSDIAEVAGGSEALLQLLDSVIIREDARDLLLSQEFPAGEILQKIRAGLDGNPDLKGLNPSFRIPSKVKVSFSSVPISRREVERKIRNVLGVRCGDCEFHIQVQSTPVPQSEKWSLDWSQMSTKGSFLIPLDDNSRGQGKWVSGTIRVSKLTPVVTRLILQGERIQDGDLRMAMTDITYAKDGVLRESDIVGQMASRALAVGTPVWASDLKREPAAQRGQVVKALIGDSGFEISAQVVAEENGFIGDIIKVKNPETKKNLSGLVIEKGVVKLQ